VKRVEWQELAERWLVDAKVLLDAHRWSAAYYVMGYAVECGLKSCVLARVAVEVEVIFTDRRFSEKCWNHNALELVRLANLEATRLGDMAANRALGANWEVLEGWSENTRYETVIYHRAKRLYKAITDKKNGVMQWIRVYW
jgi:hypothetical protein